MVVGFNHNFRYKGEVYHVQTEDGGLKSPNIVTLLYKGGNILASRKTSYADICKVDHLDKVVEELMKEQHREMLRRLKDGDFDAVIQSRKAGASASGSNPPPKAEPVATPAQGPQAGEPPLKDAAMASSLDEIILSYLVGDDEEKDVR
jgi:hypothetical protein